MDRIDKIRGLRDKFVRDEMPINEIQIAIPLMNASISKKEKQLQGLTAQLYESQSRLAAEEELLKTDTQLLDAKLEDLLSSTSKLKELESDKEALLSEVSESVALRNKLKNQKPSSKDQQTVELGRKKLKYYKQLTGIRWDFEAPKGTTKGYVTNGKDHIHTFNYKDQECGSKLKNLLWQDVLRGTGLFDEVNTNCKENIEPNK